MNNDSINIRYTKLANEACCLSCGGAVEHSHASLNEVCVDLGSGRGTDVLRLAQDVGNKGYVYGIDLSDGMIAKSKKMASKLGISHVEFIQSELEKLPIRDASVDLVISNCTINHAKNKQEVWNEVFRILKNGGRFAVSDIYAIEEVPIEYKNDPDAVAECWAGAVTRDVYLEQLQNAGFTSVDIVEESEPYEKGEIKVSSITIIGIKSNSASCCCNN
ncbi:MAG: methyltransferase domain-containing protein [Bacteroidales bacterium]|nr:methyltransferase domain-containing protein [Bacteroidales bacterium]